MTKSECQEAERVNASHNITDQLRTVLAMFGYAKLVSQLPEGCVDDHQRISFLRQAEHVVNNAQVHRAVVLCKAVIRGRRQRAEFDEQCKKLCLQRRT